MPWGEDIHRMINRSNKNCDFEESAALFKYPRAASGQNSKRQI
ncbi:hypothetical protein SMSP2_02179 [Limihaloglobus sulfuriphilus]|uniref:Uncharacterized protein n=1 Tax=Limihaloglobus sulfuriphilus TaxID=1851148 RepID=A0A1Q2MGJ3_9BACT|nr:hypothetical protein SMSP2_02179 [Limihaloglobus sulfuriphilus]